MTTFHAILIDETGREFHAYTESSNASEAYEELQGGYPESSVVRVEILGNAAPIVGILSDAAPIDERDHLRNLIAEIRGRLLCMAEMLDAAHREDGSIDVAPMLRDLADHAAAVMKGDD